VAAVAQEWLLHQQQYTRTLQPVMLLLGFAAALVWALATLGVRRLIGIRTRTPLAPIMSVSREAVPCGLAGDAEHLSDNSPGYLALSQNSDGVVQSGSSILEYGGFDLQPAKESFG